MQIKDLPTTFVFTCNFGGHSAGDTFTVEWAENFWLFGGEGTEVGTLKNFYATKFMHQLGCIKFGILADKDTGKLTFTVNGFETIPKGGNWKDKIKPVAKKTKQKHLTSS